MTPTNTTISNITPAELLEAIRSIVRAELAVTQDRGLTKAEVAQVWRCSMGTVDRAVRSGELRSVKKTGHPRFPMSQVTGSRRWAEHNILNQY
jgi:hypothetical protein